MGGRAGGGDGPNQTPRTRELRAGASFRRGYGAFALTLNRGDDHSAQG